MPVIINSEEMETRRGEGWVEITLADPQIIGTPAMTARRWIFEPGASGPEWIQGDVDQLLYVIRGSGLAVVNGQEFQLNEESLLWVEPGEHYCFIGGDGPGNFTRLCPRSVINDSDPQLHCYQLGAGQNAYPRCRRNLWE
jgi:quercetin dioxygenase-like cupin family protein